MVTPADVVEALLQEDAYDSAAQKWGSADPEQVELALDQFKILKARQLIRGTEGDIQAWSAKPFEEFRAFVDVRAAEGGKRDAAKEAAKDAERVFHNDVCDVWVPNTYEASVKLGRNTQWCTSFSGSRRWWDEYRDKGAKVYIVVCKGEYSANKFCVTVYPNDVLVHNADNVLRYLSTALSYGMPPSTFRAADGSIPSVDEEDY